MHRLEQADRIARNHNLDRLKKMGQHRSIINAVGITLGGQFAHGELAQRNVMSVNAVLLNLFQDKGLILVIRDEVSLFIGQY